MKYIKKFEIIEENKRLGTYIDVDEVFEMIKYLKNRDVRFMLLFGVDDITEEEKTFLVLIEANSHNKLEYDTSSGFATKFRDYYYILNGQKTFYNWFKLDEVNQGNWKIVNTETEYDIENIKIMLNANKYNL